jgi:hypothetical protein
MLFCSSEKKDSMAALSSAEATWPMGPTSHGGPGCDRSPGQKAANHALASLRARNEHGLAPFKHWRILHRARCCPRKIGHIAKAIHTLLTLLDLEAA